MNDRYARTWRWLGFTSLAGVVALMLFSAGGRTQAASGEKDSEPRRAKDVKVLVLGEDGDSPDVRVYASDDGDEEGEGVEENGDDARKGAYLGVSIEEDTKNSDGGARVDNVADGSPADKAGIKEGDTIVGFDGDVIRGPARLTEKIHATEPNERVVVKLVRKDGRKETVTVEMGERPRGFWYHYGDGDFETPAPDLRDLENLGDKLKKMRVHVAPRIFRFGSDKPRLGVELVETTPELREHLGGSREAGVLVGRVLQNTPAQKSGLKVGDLIVSVDGDAVHDAGDLIDVLSDKEGKTIDLEVVRDGRSQRVQVAIPKQEEDEEDEPRGPRAQALQHLRRELGRSIGEQARARASLEVQREVVQRAMEEAREQMRHAVREARRAARLSALAI